MIKWLKKLFARETPPRAPAEKFSAAEYCRRCEASATVDQQRAAIAMALVNGWKPGNNPPAWVWMMIWDSVLGRSLVEVPTNTAIH